MTPHPCSSGPGSPWRGSVVAANPTTKHHWIRSTSSGAEGVTHLTVWSNSFIDDADQAHARIAALGGWPGSPESPGSGMKRLEERVQLSSPAPRKVSGAGSPLHSAEEGATIVVVDINAEGALDTAEECRAPGVPAIGLECDISDRAQVDARRRSRRERARWSPDAGEQRARFMLGIPLLDTTREDMDGLVDDRSPRDASTSCNPVSPCSPSTAERS